MQEPTFPVYFTARQLSILCAGMRMVQTNPASHQEAATAERMLAYAEHLLAAGSAPQGGVPLSTTTPAENPSGHRPPAFEAHFRKECGMPDSALFQWDAPYMVAALDGWNAHAAQPQGAPIASPADLANDNEMFVAMQRMTDAFDSEQAQQALEALNGSRKDD